MASCIQGRYRIKLTLLVGTYLSLMLGMSTQVAAQERGAIPSSGKGLEEVIVTAQRRTERLEDVPASVAVVTGASLERQGIIHFTDFGQSVAGMQIAQTAGYVQPSIRGISTTIPGVGAENNIGIYVDGFFQDSLLTINQDMANLESVEVLKGPQGSLYGRNATGGAILIRTLDPGNTTTGKITASYGRFNDYMFTGFLSAPLVLDRLAVSIAANYHENDGYIKDINCFANPSARASTSPTRRTGTYGCNTAPYASHSARVKLKWTPSDTLSFTVGYNYAYTADARGYAYQLYDHPGTTQKAILAGTFPAAGTYQQAFNMRDRTSLSFQPWATDRSNEVTLLGTLTTGDFGTLTTHTAYMWESSLGDLDIDAAPVDTTAIYGPSSHEVFTQAIDYEYKGVSRLDLLVGGFFLRDIVTNNYQQVTALLFASPANPNGVLQTTSQYLNTPHSYSGYIDATYQLSDRLYAIAGVRYTSEAKTADYKALNAAGVFVSQRGAGQPPETTFHATTPRAVLRYNIDGGSNVYASYSQGFKSGTYNNAPGLIVPVQPERVDAYEIGAKVRRDDFRVEAAGFYYDYRNLQISKTVLNPNTNAFQSAVSNAANSKIYGAELSASASVTNSFTVSAGVAWLHARYEDFRTATGTDTRIDTQTEVNSLPSNPQNWSGLPLTRSPNFSGHIDATYTTELARGNLEITGNLFATTSYVPKDGSVVRFVNAAGATVQDTGKLRYLQPGYATLNFQATWTDASGHYSIGGYLRNATDTRYRTLFTSTSSGDFATYSEPRTFGIQAGYKF